MKKSPDQILFISTPTSPLCPLSAMNMSDLKLETLTDFLKEITRFYTEIQLFLKRDKAVKQLIAETQASSHSSPRRKQIAWKL